MTARPCRRRWRRRTGSRRTGCLPRTSPGSRSAGPVRSGADQAGRAGRIESAAARAPFASAGATSGAAPAAATGKVPARTRSASFATAGVGLDRGLGAQQLLVARANCRAPAALPDRAVALMSPRATRPSSGSSDARRRHQWQAAGRSLAASARSARLLERLTVSSRERGPLVVGPALEFLRLPADMKPVQERAGVHRHGLARLVAGQGRLELPTDRTARSRSSAGARALRQ